jgi:hypothetical protein
MTQSHSVDPVIDPRGPRFAAWVTTAVLVIVLVTASTLLLAAQAIVFAVGAFAGLQLHPYGLIYRTFVAPVGGPRTSPIRPRRRPRLYHRRHQRIRHRTHRAGPHRYRPCARRGLPQRRIWLVPGLRDLPPVTASVAQPTSTP